MMTTTPPTLVAHRGYCSQYPENTMPAIVAALNAGALFIEFDVQISKDGIPFVIHDDTLFRTGQNTQSVFNLMAHHLELQCVGNAVKFGDKFSGTTVPKLSQVLQLLDEWRNATFFVEIKRKSLNHFGIEYVMSKVFNDLKPYLDRTILISFNKDALIAARKLGVNTIGWIFEPWDDYAIDTAQALKPNYLLTDYETIPDSVTTLWPGPWQWVLYELSNPVVAKKVAAYGAQFIETNDIGAMIQSPEFLIG